MKKILFTLTLLFAISITAFAQTARIKGVILDENNKPIEDVNVSCNGKTTVSDKDGFYSLLIPANKKVVVVFSHATYKGATQTLDLKPNYDFEFNPVLNTRDEQLGEVIIVNNKKRVQGITTISPEIIRRIPSAMPGVESILKLMAGVNSNNELSSQYSARGGNYDENLVYVNEVEVYRPFLIRSGQQEGLSFTNTDLVKNVDFSAGGFQAKYGDKMSSVLDITYRKPKAFGASLEASLLGGSASADLVSKDQRWSAVTGIRYRNNSLLVKSQQTQTNYHPSFADFQTNINFDLNTKWQFSFLGNASQNNYKYEPFTRQTNFGTLSEPIALLIFYEGQEKDKYQTLFGAVKTTYKHNENNTYKLINSAYHTQEQEYFDIDASYYLGEVDTNIGNETYGGVTYSRGIGSQLTHARNNLDALIVNTEVKGSHSINKKHFFDWGLKYTKENIRDRIVEWEVIDSAGFSLNNPIIENLPHNDEPYTPYTGPLVPYKNVRATNFVDINRISAYAQYSTKLYLGKNQFWINAGLRGQNWIVTNGDSHTVISPRAQFTLKPNWDKDILFRFSTGFYYQPPFYRELRDMNGVVNPNVDAQKSIHYVLGNDYGFKMWNRKFKLTSELYYKSMTNVNTYTIENVRIRYRANNNATAYAYGFDCRFNGEFVPGSESWFSFGYLKTQENQDDRGWVARPTDQRLKFAILFQDYMPAIPNLKAYINLTYNTGLPGGSPSYADVYQYQNRLRDYRRADVGFFYVFTDKNNERPKDHWLRKFNDLSVGMEIFNIFNNLNAITNTWVRDAYTKSQYAIPNYMTTRVFNFKITARL